MYKKDYEWANEIALKIYEKSKASAERSKDKVPYLTENGTFDDWSDRIFWWTNGFYGGQMWQLYHAFGDELFKQVAENIEGKLNESFNHYWHMDHDNGFKWLLTSVANYKVTGNEDERDKGLLAANNLAGRFNLAGNFIRAWNDSGDGKKAGWAIIDCMMNLPLLYWASEELHDPRFAQIAKAHADTALKAFVREDGSVHHIVQFDVNTGEIVGVQGGQGKGEGTSWTRGQAWAIYGFALSYRHTGDEKYLETAKGVATYFANNLQESGLVPVDFYQDKELDWEDSTAAAIAACGMLEIEKHVAEMENVSEGNAADISAEAAFFHETAMKLLKTLVKQRCNWDTSVDNITENCSAAYHDKNHNFTIIYGDYFFTEAIFKLCDKELFMW